MPFARPLDRGGVANVAGDEFDVVCNIGEPARMPARIVVEHAHAAARAQQRLHQAGADEAAAAGDEDAGAHEAASRPISAPAVAIQAPLRLRTPRGVDQLLGAIAFGKSGLRCRRFRWRQRIAWRAATPARCGHPDSARRRDR